MSVVSIDVGMKNLAVCVFLGVENILKWDVVDISTVEESLYCSCHLAKKGTVCGKPAKYLEPNTAICGKPNTAENASAYCKTHAKSSPYFIPTKKTQSISAIKKMKVADLHEYAKKIGIPHLEGTKDAAVQTIWNFLQSKTLIPVAEKQNAGKINLTSLGKNMMTKLDLFFQDLAAPVETVVIENQVSPIANRMKTLQGMLSQYFIMRYDSPDIRFASSSNKLRDVDETKKATYKDRKNAGIAYCREILGTYPAKWSAHFEGHKKKDDMADSFLQGLHFLSVK